MDNTEDYVSFETAELLKERGFDWETCAYWDLTTETHTPKIVIEPTPRNWNYKWKIFLLPVSAPTLQMAMKWLREVHNYVISICLDSYVEPYDNQYYIFIRRRKDKYEEVSPCEQVFFDTYEKACEAAIKYCLENLI